MERRRLQSQLENVWQTSNRGSGIHDVVSIGKYGHVLNYPTAAQLLWQDDHAANVYLVHQGLVKLVYTAESGRETIIGLRGNGDFIGVAACLAQAPCASTAITLCKAKLERIASDRFQRLLRSDTDFMMRVFQSHSMEILEQSESLAHFASDDAEGRLENILRKLESKLAGERDADGRIRLPLRKKELAQLAATSPQHLSTLLARRPRAITYSNGHLILHTAQARRSS